LSENVPPKMPNSVLKTPTLGEVGVKNWNSEHPQSNLLSEMCSCRSENGNFLPRLLV